MTPGIRIFPAGSLISCQTFHSCAWLGFAAHEWLVWKNVKLPDGKILIPGLITHHTMIVEHPELIAWRLSNFASLVGRKNVIAGTDCGFAQSATTVRVHPNIQWAKLEGLVEGARLASKELWR